MAQGVNATPLEVVFIQHRLKYTVQIVTVCRLAEGICKDERRPFPASPPSHALPECSRSRICSRLCSSSSARSASGNGMIRFPAVVFGGVVIFVYTHISILET